MTDKILVSMICSIKVHMQIRNRPRRNHGLDLLRLSVLIWVLSQLVCSDPVKTVNPRRDSAGLNYDNCPKKEVAPSLGASPPRASPGFA